jgi:hypothetical protein
MLLVLWSAATSDFFALKPKDLEKISPAAPVRFPLFVQKNLHL